MSNDTILSLHNIVKRYPGVLALDSVGFDLQRGEVHALVGENGAGKSTIIKVITGAIQPDSGTIAIDGAEYGAMTPQLSEKMGIAAIYQELTLFNYLSVAENIFFGREPHKGIFVDYNRMHKESEEIFKRIGITLKTNTIVESLGIAYQQIVEIGKAISHNSKILIMDEPSASLTAREMESLYEIVRTLKAQNVSIIYISHRMEEIFDICDRVTVMRDGRYITTKDVKDTNRSDLIKLMVGRELTGTYPQRAQVGNPVVLKATDLCSQKLNHISFELKKGEILGLGGLVGAGRTEVARALFGADAHTSGTIDINGKAVDIKHPKDAIACGIGLIPEDRKQQGLLLDLSVMTNINFASMDQISNGPFVIGKQEHETAKRFCESLKVKTPSVAQIAKNLSGGNQQKVVLAKWMAVNCDIIIFDEPTRGIDVGAKMEIYELMNAMVAMGKSIIMISSDMPELIGMSDRIIVMRHGKIMGQVEKEDVTQEKILDLASRD